MPGRKKITEWTYPPGYVFTPLRHAYEYRHKYGPKDEPLWCDKGGCFMRDCAECQSHVSALRTSQMTLWQ